MYLRQIVLHHLFIQKSSHLRVELQVCFRISRQRIKKDSADAQADLLFVIT